jgi:hypothetical protein
MATMRSGMRSKPPPPPPPDQSVFNIVDSDSDGLVSTIELATLVKGIQHVTGNSIDVNDALTSYDSDQDGGLNSIELLSLLNNNGFSQSLDIISEDDSETASQPPPPPPPDEAMASYARNSVDDLMLQLLDRLRESGVNETDTLAIDVLS